MVFSEFPSSKLSCVCKKGEDFRKTLFIGSNDSFSPQPFTLLHKILLTRQWNDLEKVLYYYIFLCKNVRKKKPIKFSTYGLKVNMICRNLATSMHFSSHTQRPFSMSRALPKNTTFFQASNMFRRFENSRQNPRHVIGNKNSSRKSFAKRDAVSPTVLNTQEVMPFLMTLAEFLSETN